MSQPPYPYNRIFDFESFSINTPAAQQPGVQLEGEYDAIKRTIDGLISRLAEIQRADGKIDGNALSAETYSAIYTTLAAMLQPTFNLYLLKTGGTISGKLTVNTDLSNPSINIGSNKNAGTYLNAIAGDIWISQQQMFYKDGNGNLRQTVALNTSNSFTNWNSINQGDNVYPSLSVTQTKDAGALLVTNTGLGYSFKVEDSASPDGTPFLIDNAGHVGVGVTPSTAVGLSVDSTGILFSPSTTPQTVPFLPSAVALTGGTIGPAVTVTTATASDSTTKIASTAFVTTADNLKANIASPSLTGTPLAPTAAAGTNSTQIATTAFVTAADSLKANLASPAFTGTPTAPTASANTNTTQVATTAYVTTANALKSNIDSPTFTGIPRAPTATAGLNSTQIATTAFVTAADNLKANIDSPTFTGTPRVPTPSANDNGTKIASTEFVKTAISNLVASAPGTLDTLNELAAALGNDPSFATTVTNSIATKLSIATAENTYYPLNSNPAGYLTTSTLPPLNYLPLNGGTMSVNANVIFPQYDNKDSEIGSWGFGVENTDGAYTTVEPTLIRTRTPAYEDNSESITSVTAGYISVGNDIADGNPLNYTNISSGSISLRTDDTQNVLNIGSYGITFPNSTVQETAGLPISGGTLTGSVFININNQGENTLELDASGITSLSQQVNSFNIDAYGVSGHDELINQNGVNWGFGVNGALFTDGSVQTTAGLPIPANDPDDLAQAYNNNGVWTNSPTFLDINAFGNIYVDNDLILNAGTPAVIKFDDGGFEFRKTNIKFPDGSTQASAFIPSNYFPKPTGTTSQYIDGTGSLQTFPIVTSVGKMVTSVYNNSGAAIPKGSVVYINGKHGSEPTIALSRADAEATSAYTIGVTETSISNNSSGNIVTSGTIENIATNSYSDGTPLYLSATTAGALTATKQFAPNHYVKIGTVINAHPTAGTIFIKIENGYELDELSDCSVTAPANNNVLTYESSTSLWKDKSVSTALGYAPANQTLGNLSSASTARTNLGLAYATEAQVIAGTSASTVMTPSNGLWSVMNPAFNAMAFTGATSSVGGGGGTSQGGSFGFRVNSGTAAASFAAIRNGASTSYPTSRGVPVGNIDWSKIVIVSGVCTNTLLNSVATNRCLFGTVSTGQLTDLTNRGIGFRQVGTSAIELQVHNGTTLTNVTSSFTPTANTPFDFLVYSDGTGNATLYINDASVATTGSAPIGVGANTQNFLGIGTEISANVATTNFFSFGNIKTFYGR